MTETTTRRSSAAESTDTSSTAQGRFTVAIPAAVKPLLDDLQKSFSSVNVNGVDLVIDLTPAQVITSLIKSAHASLGNGSASDEG